MTDPTRADGQSLSEREKALLAFALETLVWSLERNYWSTPFADDVGRGEAKIIAAVIAEKLGLPDFERARAVLRGE